MFTKWSREYHSTVHFACTAPIQSCGGLYPAKTNLQDHARILQESCMQVLLGTCTRYVPFLARFLHNLAHILQEMVQDFARVAARIITCIFFARSCKNWCKIVHQSCKKRDISHTRLACKILGGGDLACKILGGGECSADK